MKRKLDDFLLLELIGERLKMKTEKMKSLLVIRKSDDFFVYLIGDWQPEKFVGERMKSF